LFSKNLSDSLLTSFNVIKKDAPSNAVTNMIIMIADKTDFEEPV